MLYESNFPSSFHFFGRTAKTLESAVRKNRDSIAASASANPLCLASGDRFIPVQHRQMPENPTCEIHQSARWLMPKATAGSRPVWQQEPGRRNNSLIPTLALAKPHGPSTLSIFHPPEGGQLPELLPGKILQLSHGISSPRTDSKASGVMYLFACLLIPHRPSPLF